ncbi:hypothetical protein [Paractinoplanes brasiliensis]|uniref:Uncharacterized protein n=1 Tax=Paractinoplanes brasiliensis TaxID=52695 RepID=A0A4R6JL16_9ACTN|nr:hypothetical protein [Actinoplanes brasiliensis]TDO36970.1 hypothetical protein C8E87_0562 [Actinoplanes brasiliensis]GID30493.1 hypothetical protein Abr02nite_54760 [Actinoplanes brasiliensis]
MSAGLRVTGASPADAASLARRLGRWADQLRPAERVLLERLLAGSMDPMERMRFLEPVGLLSAEEAAVVAGAAGPGAGRPA